MSPRPLLASALAVLAPLALPAAAPAQVGGGAAAPGTSGGAQYGDPPAPRRPDPLVLRYFRIAPATIPAGADSARLAFRVEGGAPRVVVRFSIVAAADRRMVHTRVLRARTGRRHVRDVALPGAAMTPGSYVAVVHAGAAGSRGPELRAAAASTRFALQVAAPAPPSVSAPPPPAAAAPAPPPPAATPARSIAGGVFPVRGAYSFGGDGARFGSDRGDRLHRGQDVVAAEGTPLVAPRAGTIHVRGYQGGGAGHYLVLRGADRRDYVFMHMREASPLAPGAPVAAGALIGHVGNTGSSSGAHLHFEIWPNGWYASAASAPIDPLPELLAWAGA
jgi:murein DD-endopeptidase MepM/ murein hydrolase activator NlpD